MRATHLPINAVDFTSIKDERSLAAALMTNAAWQPVPISPPWHITGSIGKPGDGVEPRWMLHHEMMTMTADAINGDDLSACAIAWDSFSRMLPGGYQALLKLFERLVEHEAETYSKWMDELELAHALLEEYGPDASVGDISDDFSIVVREDGQGVDIDGRIYFSDRGVIRNDGGAVFICDNPRYRVFRLDLNSSLSSELDKANNHSAAHESFVFRRTVLQNVIRAFEMFGSVPFWDDVPLVQKDEMTNSRILTDTQKVWLRAALKLSGTLASEYASAADYFAACAIEYERLPGGRRVSNAAGSGWGMFVATLRVCDTKTMSVAEVKEAVEKAAKAL